MGTFEAIEMTVVRFVRDRQRSVVIRSLRGEPEFSVAIAENVRRPAASLMKLPLAMSLYDMEADGLTSLNNTVQPRQLPATRYPSIFNVFQPDHTFLISELCGIMLSTSDNPSAQYLVEMVGTERVNALLRNFGCTDSRMITGYADKELTSPLARSNYSTAADMSEILRTAYTHQSYKKLLDFLKQGLRKYRLPLFLPEDILTANKTGSLDGVVNDAAIFYGDRYDIAIAVLADNEESDHLTSLEMAQLGEEVWRLLGERLDE